MSGENIVCPSCEKRICKNQKSVGCMKTCNRWYHFKCTSLTERQFSDIARKLLTWTCEQCEDKKDKNLSVAELEQSLSDLGGNIDLDASLTIAAEAGKILLAENEKLKQEIHSLKLTKKEAFLHLEHDYQELEIKLSNVINESDKKIDHLENLLQLYTDALYEKEKEIDLKNAVIDEIRVSLEVVENAWKVDREALENNLSKELNELKSFYQPGDVVLRSSNTEIITANYFSPLVACQEKSCVPQKQPEKISKP